MTDAEDIVGKVMKRRVYSLQKDKMDFLPICRKQSLWLLFGPLNISINMFN